MLIGSGRLMDAVSNLFLPFAWAIAMMESDSQLIQKITEFSIRVPRGEIPAIVRNWASRIKLPRKFFRKNYQIQGAIELSHSFCNLDLCKLCPLEDYAG